MFFILLLMNKFIYSCDTKLDFQHHYSRLQCHMIQKYLRKPWCILCRI